MLVCDILCVDRNVWLWQAVSSLKCQLMAYNSVCSLWQFQFCAGCVHTDMLVYGRLQLVYGNVSLWQAVSGWKCKLLTG